MKELIVFTNIEKNNSYVQGSLQDFYWEKVTHEIMNVPCVHFNVEIILIRQCLTKILKCDFSIDDMEENIYHWLYYF